jgi:DUF4097 and DUF4098 domain-containing protein YvlB
VVKGGFCDVNIEGDDRSKIDFVGQLNGTNNSGDVKIMHRQSGNVLEVWIDRPERNNWSWGFNNLNGKLDFKVPSNIEIIVNNSSGNVFATNIKYATCELSASSGDVKGINITANLKIVATSGDIRAEQINGNVRAKTTSGGLELKTVKGEIEADATSGNIRIDATEGNIDAGTTSGSIDIDGAKGIFALSSTSGDIEGKYVELTGNSTFKSTSGSIDIRLKNDMKMLNFDLSASSGSLRAAGISSERKLLLKNGNGNIEIRGVSSSGDQSYAD